MRTIFFVTLTVLCSLSSFAQEDSTTKKTVLKFELSYINNSVYLGRKDSSELSYFTPGIFYTAPSGFFASANLSFLTQESRVDAATLEAGYDYAAGNFDASLSAAKFFYNNQSVNVKSTVSAGLNAYLTYETLYLTPVLNGSISFGNNQPDYFAGFGLEHSFYAGNTLTVTPSVTANGGTQHFYDGYYKLRKGGKKKLVSASVTQETLNASAFKILDYELAADLTCKVKNFSFFATPVYAIATNPNVIVTTVYRPNGAVLTSQSKVENLSNSFYCTVGVSYRLPLN
ncbi:hypothetical protein [Flavisolibacter ginsenosidimutans]|uniref:Uncharacterized protein n=1 Tax=Flavisolibacter ginsenosidimutans TaxID=661481 RepID=A0A5B8UL22_9BACT|nr:hypothetical protein [Flavisolibacter ginsenosidimutans]QEC57263.1 hypothetical protein FSB75_15610 [Flavisolibacter ginsenosidimutans]